MKTSEAIDILNTSLIAYVDDSAGRETEEAKLIEKAWQTIKDKLSEGGQLFYYAIYHEGDYLATGLNYTDPEAVKEGVLSLNEPQMEDEDFEKLKSMSLEDICDTLGYVLEKNAQPI